GDGSEATRRLLSYINRTHDVDFTLVGKMTGGFQGGAWRVHDSAGRAAVLKWSANQAWGPKVVQAAPVIAAARRAGWPTPAWLLVGQTSRGYPYEIQEHCDRTPAGRVDHALIREVTPILQLQRGLYPDTDHDHSRYAYGAVFGDESGLQEQLRNHSTTTAALLDEIVDWTAPYRDVSLPTDDLVHGDFNPDNILRTDETITALVDTDAVGKGTYLSDLATLLCSAALWDSEAGSIEKLLAIANAGRGELEIVVSACLLALVAFAITHEPAAADTNATRASGLIAAIRRHASDTGVGIPMSDAVGAGGRSADAFAAAVSERYGLGTAEAITSAHRGAMGQIWRLVTSRGVFAVKEFFWGADEAAAAREADFCRRATAAGVRAPGCIRATSGSLTALVGGKTVRVYEWVDGETVEKPTGELARWAAHTMAVLHSLEYPADGQVVDPWYAAIPEIEEFAALAAQARSIQLAWGDVRDNALPRIDRLVRSLPDDQPNSVPIYCHRDMNPQNILLTSDGPCLVDWDDAGPAYPERELLTMLYRWGPGSGEPTRAAKMARAYGMDRQPIDYGAFRELVAGNTNYIKVQAELALDADAPDDMRSQANIVVTGAIGALPTPEQLNQLIDAIQR
ncbi:MAG: phosphotransferase, partial [Mycobacterium sp.]|nr:phosphotransferase [Mycobacterium sp.]